MKELIEKTGKELSVRDSLEEKVAEKEVLMENDKNLAESKNVSEAEEMPKESGFLQAFSKFLDISSKLQAIKERMGFSSGKQIEKITATPENISALLKQIGPEYKNFLMKTYKATEWGNDSYSRKVEYPFVCNDSSLILGSMLADYFGLEIGGESPNKIDLINGYYGGYDSVNHYWLKVTIDGKFYFVDSVLQQQSAYMRGVRELYEMYEQKDNKSYKQRVKASMQLLIKTLDELPSEIIFKPYEEALKEFGADYGIRENTDVKKVIRNDQFANLRTQTQEAIEKIRGLKTLKSVGKNYVK